MSVRRQLVNFGSTSTDYRVGTGAFDELPRLFKNVVGEPKRALLAYDELASDEQRSLARRALIDCGFTVEEYNAAGKGACEASLDASSSLMRMLASSSITADDVMVALGGANVCSLVSYCGQMWCGGMSCAAIPLTLDAMCTVPTAMRPLSVDDAPEMVSVRPGWSLVVCDIDLVLGKDARELGLGYAYLLGAAFASSRRVWEQCGEKVAGMADDDPVAFADALCAAQTSRAGAVRSANPSARNSIYYGISTARALRACLKEKLPSHLALAEGMRFEARLAHDVCGLDVDLVFEQDDRFDDLGVEEAAFDVDVDTFIDALKRTCYVRSNRFMLALPKFPGAIRLCHIEEDVLRRHAEAYLASRAELLEEL